MTTNRPFKLQYYPSTTDSDITLLILPDLMQSSERQQAVITDFTSMAHVIWLDYQLVALPGCVHWQHSYSEAHNALTQLLQETPVTANTCIAQGLGCTLAPNLSSFQQIIYCNPPIYDNGARFTHWLASGFRLLSKRPATFIQGLIEDHWRDQFGIPMFDEPAPWMTPDEHQDETPLSNGTWYTILSFMAQNAKATFFDDTLTLFGGECPTTVDALLGTTFTSNSQVGLYPSGYANLLLASQVRQDIKKHCLERL